MNTLKTAVVVVLLLVVLYGVYTTLSQPPKPPPAEVAAAKQELQELNVEMPTGLGPPGPDSFKSGPNGAPAPPALQAPPLQPPIQPGNLGGAPPIASLGAPQLEGNPSAAAADGGNSTVSGVPSISGGAIASPGSSATGVSSPLPSATGGAPTAGGDPKTSAYARLTPDASDPGPSGGVAANPAAPQAASDNSLNLGAKGVEMAWNEAQNQLKKGKLAEALKGLSAWYRSPDLKPDQSAALLKLLDQLAGTVVYSTESHLEPVYLVKKGETLEQIAAVYQIPAQLLGNINGLRAPYPLVPGQSLKVVRGPLRAEVDLAPPQQLTLFLGDYYAGRFDVAVGAGPAPVPGNYSILQKQVDHPFFSPEGQTIPAGAPGHPYGKHWMGLESQISIHGSGGAADSIGKGCISLSPKDAEDVFGILSVGSRITIRR